MEKEDKLNKEQKDLIFELKEKIQDQAEEISSLKKSLQEQSLHMSNKDAYIQNLEHELNRIKHNKIWRTIQTIYTLLFLKTINGVVFFADKVKAYCRRIKSLGFLGIYPAGYQRWIKKHSPSPKKIESIKTKIEGFAQKPIISLILPIYNPEKEQLEKALDSVLGQYYSPWELCIVDDASTEEYIQDVLEKYKKKDKRLKVKYLKTRGGISEASNEALSLATGEYAAVMNNSMELSLDGLFEVASQIIRSPQTDLIYSDEDKIDSNQKRIQPVFRLKWSVKRFLTHPYPGLFFVCRKKLIDDAGGFRKDYDGCQDYDLLLRITRLTNFVYHIPKILYHRRITQELTASQTEQQKQSFEKARLALRSEMEKRGWNVLVKDGRRKGSFKIKMIE